MTSIQLSDLDDDTIISLFAYACETHDESAADGLEAEIKKRGIYGRVRTEEKRESE